jgi:PAS domain S-box-containing protein
MVAQPQLPVEAYRAILESLPTGVYLVDRDRRIVFWNDGCERITGYLRHEVIGRSCAADLLMHCDEKRDALCGVACPLVATMHDGKPREAHIFLRHRNGQRLPVLVRAIPVRDDRGAIVGACESFDQREFPFFSQFKEQLTELHAPLDEVTGLAGRHTILDRIGHELHQLETPHLPFGVLCLGIDNPEGLRSTDGTVALNQILYATAQTLSANIGPGNLVGRWSDTKFAAIVHGCTGQSLLEFAFFLKRLAGLEAVPWWGGRLTVTVSAAGTMARLEDTGEDLVGRAEAAFDEIMQMQTNQAAVV